MSKRKTFSSLALTSLAILTLAACQKQESSSVEQSTTTATKQTVSSSKASSSQKDATTKSSKSAKKTATSSSKTQVESSRPQQESTETTEQETAVQSAGVVNQAGVVQAPVETGGVSETAPAQTNQQDSVFEFDSSALTMTQEEIEASVKKKIEEIPSLVQQLADPNNPGIGIGAATPEYEAELKKQGYFEKLNQALEEAGVTNPWEGQYN